MRDGRASYREIATRTSLTTPTVSLRLSRMRKGGPVRGFEPIIDPAASQRVLAFVKLRIPEKSVGQTTAKLAGFEEVKGIFFISGPDNVTLKVIAEERESPRNTQKALRLMGVEITHHIVLNWIRKYVGMMQRYVEKITPEVGEAWRADELYFKVEGDMKYLFAIMDEDTRFWIAQQVADTKYTADVRPLFAEAKEKAEKIPLTLTTDGGQHFVPAFKKEFLTADRYAQHIRKIRLDAKEGVHNNILERMNGEVRDR